MPPEITAAYPESEQEPRTDVRSHEEPVAMGNATKIKRTFTSLRTAKYYRAMNVRLYKEISSGSRKVKKCRLDVSESVRTDRAIDPLSLIVIDSFSSDKGTG